MSDDLDENILPLPPEDALGGLGGSGQLPLNILFFARALREAGLPVGPGAVIDAIEAVEAAGFSSREDFYAALHAVFVKKHDHSIVFDQAFWLFWRRRGFMEKIIALMSPVAEPRKDPPKPKAGTARVQEALMKRRDPQSIPPKQEEQLDMRLTMSADEILQAKDFAQMSAAEIARAQEAIAKLRMKDDAIVMRRFRSSPHGTFIDPRATFRKSLRAGGAVIDLGFRKKQTRQPPIVAICDISGSMSDYSRVFLHFLHTMTDQRRRVHTFLFGTRLTNVTRALRSKDIDEALNLCTSEVKDWSGGTRIGASLHVFNTQWSRRVLGQGATVLLFTDGLERDGLDVLKREMERLGKSCRRLVWVNPLLRFAAFEAKASGIRTMLPFCDEFRPIHNLASMADLCVALSDARADVSTDPRLWLRRAA